MRYTGYQIAFFFVGKSVTEMHLPVMLDISILITELYPVYTMKQT